MINPRKYNYDYTSKNSPNNSNRSEFHNNIPTIKSRSRSKDNPPKDSNYYYETNNNDINENMVLIDKSFKNIDLYDMAYQLLCVIIKHYLCANDAIIDTFKDELRNIAINSVNNKINIQFYHNT